VDDRIESLYEQARADRAAFTPPVNPPDEDQAMSFLTDGAGQAVWVYIDGRTGEWKRFSQAEYDRLEWAMNAWLELYSACYGTRIEASYPLRVAAELLLETHNIRDVAQLLTHVPARP
jgi:hypothetical protein